MILDSSKAEQAGRPERFPKFRRVLIPRMDVQTLNIGFRDLDDARLYTQLAKKIRLRTGPDVADRNWTVIMYLYVQGRPLPANMGRHRPVAEPLGDPMGAGMAWSTVGGATEACENSTVEGPTG